MLDREELLRRIQLAQAQYWAWLAAERREKVHRLLADAEQAMNELARLCEDPNLREIVAREFRVLESALAALAVAAGAVAPEPEEVGK